MWPLLKTLCEVQLFLGFANFYHRFIENFAGTSKPLTALSKKEAPFIWCQDCKKAFKYLKPCFTSTPVLTHYHPHCSTFVETDASNYAVAAVLSQIDPADN